MSTTFVKNRHWSPVYGWDENGIPESLPGIEVPISPVDGGNAVFVKDEEFTLVRPHDEDTFEMSHWWIVKNSEGKEFQVFASDFHTFEKEEN